LPHAARVLSQAIDEAADVIIVAENRSDAREHGPHVAAAVVALVDDPSTRIVCVDRANERLQRIRPSHRRAS